jgi:hypothetical protein
MLLGRGAVRSFNDAGFDTHPESAPPYIIRQPV